MVVATGCETTQRPTTPDVWSNPQTEVQVYDEYGNPDPGGTSAQRLSRQVWGLTTPMSAPEELPLRDELDRSAALAGGAPAADPDRDPGQDPVPQDPQQQEDERRRREALLRATFGNEVIIGSDGRITKRYSLGSESGPVFVNLLTPFSTGQAPDPSMRKASVGGEDSDTVLGRMLGTDNPVELVYLKDFERVYNWSYYQAPNAPPKPPVAVPEANSMLLATGKPSAILAFEQALNLFFANMPQVEIDVLVVEYTTTDTLSFGVDQVALGPNSFAPTLENLSTGQLVQNITSQFPLSPPLLGGGGVDAQGLITLGGIHDDWQLSATIQLLETQGIADVKSNPKLVVRNGGLATVTTKTEVPFPKAQISNQTVISTDINFKEIGITLSIRPEIAGTDTVILAVDASVSAVTSFADTDPVDTPIVATRKATTSVHLKQGQTTGIGGLVSESTIESEQKIPLLGDIPLLGYLFRSSTSTVQKTVLEFYVTPRILTGERGFSPDTFGSR